MPIEIKNTERIAVDAAKNAFLTCNFPRPRFSTDVVRARIETLRSLINFYRSSATKQEMTDRCRKFGISIPEINEAIERGRRYIELVESNGGSKLVLARRAHANSEFRKLRDLIETRKTSNQCMLRNLNEHSSLIGGRN